MFFLVQLCEQNEIILVYNLIDIKYINRTDLVLLVKAIMSKLKAYAKDCTDKINKIMNEKYKEVAEKTKQLTDYKFQIFLKKHSIKNDKLNIDIK